jgi:hypothetical protein
MAADGKTRRQASIVLVVVLVVELAHAEAQGEQ